MICTTLYIKNIPYLSSSHVCDNKPKNQVLNTFCPLSFEALDSAGKRFSRIFRRLFLGRFSNIITYSFVVIICFFSII